MNITTRTLLRAAAAALLAMAAALPGLSQAQTPTTGFHFDSICRSDPTANKNTVTLGSPYKSMQVDFYQRVTGIGITNKNLQVNAS